ncbi:MAG: hypothetical protein J0I24_15690 [Thiomonas arsenitoxydans]|uniref:Uncharacterized protein n=1 Tax=Thiomonas arsenitoxydans (strain DSM 22701 / CIP 110005 / 3As) TaxID=426114 RepID=A0A8I1SYQ4_THIA3|nr:MULTISPECIES: hypothetical protein [Thiomonas]MBN8745716.1 hypothetical protein [Thiomonas arsenitoxydans]ODU91511.1 MAG: hypothetical protein ABT24_14575 [Thiomonas sp. SCN 64-16]
MTEQTKPLNNLFDRLDAAAKLSRQLSGKAAARTVCEAFVSERLADLQALQRSGVPLARYARLIAPRLGVRPAALLEAVRRAGLSAAVSAPRAATEAKTPPTAPPPAAKPSASSVPSLAPSLAPSQAPSGVSGLELPDWADGSDRLPEESEADYVLRKHLEGPPAAGVKAIGESPAERAVALLKSGKLTFGADGPTESDRKTLIALIERFGANAVERRIDVERKTLPPGGKLYPSTLRTRMTGESHA